MNYFNIKIDYPKHMPAENKFNYRKLPLKKKRNVNKT